MSDISQLLSIEKQNDCSALFVPVSLNWWLQLDSPMVVEISIPFKQRLLLRFRATGLVSHRDQSQGEGHAALLQLSAFMYPKGMVWLLRREENQSLPMVPCVVANLSFGRSSPWLKVPTVLVVWRVRPHFQKSPHLPAAGQVTPNQPAPPPLGPGPLLQGRAAGVVGPDVDTLFQSFLLLSGEIFFSDYKSNAYLMGKIQESIGKKLIINADHYI